MMSHEGTGLISDRARPWTLRPRTTVMAGMMRSSLQSNGMLGSPRRHSNCLNDGAGSPVMIWTIGWKRSG